MVCELLNTAPWRATETITNFSKTSAVKSNIVLKGIMVIEMKLVS